MPGSAHFRDLQEAQRKTESAIQDKAAKTEATHVKSRDHMKELDEELTSKFDNIINTLATMQQVLLNLGKVKNSADGESLLGNHPSSFPMNNNYRDQSTDIIEVRNGLDNQRCSINSGFNIKPPPMTYFPKFDGSNPRSWMIRCAQYFEVTHNICDQQKIVLASAHFEGRAASWYQYLVEKQLKLNWEDFLELVSARFEDIRETITFRKLEKLKQDGSYYDYVDKFEELIWDVPMGNEVDLFEDYFISRFIKGLSEKLQGVLLAMEPKSLFEAIELGRKQSQILVTISKSNKLPIEMAAQRENKIYYYCDEEAETYSHTPIHVPKPPKPLPNVLALVEVAAQGERKFGYSGDEEVKFWTSVIVLKGGTFYVMKAFTNKTYHPPAIYLTSAEANGAVLINKSDGFQEADISTGAEHFEVKKIESEFFTIIIHCKYLKLKWETTCTCEDELLLVHASPFDPGDDDLNLVGFENFLLLFKEDKTLLIQMTTPGSNRCAGLATNSGRIVTWLEGVTKTRVAELGSSCAHILGESIWKNELIFQKPSTKDRLSFIIKNEWELLCKEWEQTNAKCVFARIKIVNVAGNSDMQNSDNHHLCTSPFLALHGYSPQFSMDSSLGFTYTNMIDLRHERLDFLELWKEHYGDYNLNYTSTKPAYSQQERFRLLQGNLQLAQQQFQTYGDINNQNQNLEAGVEVYLTRERSQRNLASRHRHLKWSSRHTRQSTLSEKIGVVAYRLWRPPWNAHLVCHGSLLKKMLDSKIPQSLQVSEINCDCHLIDPAQTLEERNMRHGEGNVSQFHIQWSKVGSELTSPQGSKHNQAKFKIFHPWGQGCGSEGGIVTYLNICEERIMDDRGFVEEEDKNGVFRWGIDWQQKKDDIINLGSKGRWTKQRIGLELLGKIQGPTFTLLLLLHGHC